MNAPDLESQLRAITTGSSEDAERTLREVARLMERAEQAGDAVAFAWSLLAQGQTLYHLSRYPEATYAAADAIEAMRALEQAEGELRSLNLLARCWLTRGDHAQALEVLRPAAERARELEDREMEGTFLSNIAYISGVKPDPVAYVDQMRPVVDIFRELGHAEKLALALTNLGGGLNQTGGLVESRVVHQEAIQLARSCGARRVEAIALGGLGELESIEHNWAKAQSLLWDARLIFAELGLTYDSLRSVLLVGRLMLDQGYHAHAVKVLREAWQQAASEKLRGVEAELLTLLAEAYDAIEDTRSAEVARSRFATVLAEPGPPSAEADASEGESE